MSPDDSWHRRMDGVIEASWLGSLLLAPVLVAPHHALPFPQPKAAILAVFAVLGIGAWVVKAFTGGPLYRPLPAAGAATAGVRRLALGLALAAISLAVSTAGALAPRLALFGAHPRAMGAVTQLSVVALAALALGHLRRREQMVRILEVCALASLPLCLYALLQAFGADPLHARAPNRPFSLAGNANILGRYLLSAVFLTVGLLVETAREGAGGFRAGTRQGLLVGLLALQGWTLLVTGARGPLLGLLAGAMVLAWGLWSLRGIETSSRMPRGLAVVTCLAIVAFAALGWHHQVTRTRPAKPLERGVGGLVDAGTRTARVRLELWRQAATAFAATEPLAGAAGPDRLHGARPWIGHGPGLAGPGLVRAGGEDLARLEPDRIADQAHNQVWDLLLTGGVLGLCGWILTHGALVEILLAALGLLRRGADVARLWGSLGAGALGGALAASWAVPASGLAVPGAVGGLLVGGGLFALVRSSRGAPMTAAADPRLATLVAAALAARWVAGQFGIETEGDVLVVTLLGPLLAAAALPATREPATAAAPSVLPAAAAAIALALLWTFAAARPASLAAPALPTAGPEALLWLLGATLAFAAALARGPARRIPLAALPMLALAVLWQRLVAAWLGTRVAAGALHWAGALARHEIVLAIALVAVLAGGAVAVGARVLAPPAGRIGPRAVALAAAAALAAGLAIGALALRPLAAGFLLRAGARARAAGEPTVALDLARAAARHAGDPTPAAILEAALERDLAGAAPDTPARLAHLDRAAAALGRGLDVAPFHSDLVGNLGLIELERLRWVERGARATIAARAAEHFAAALALRPVGGPWARHLAASRRAAAAAGSPGPP